MAKLSEEARKARNKYVKEWRDKNKDKVTASQARYWNKKTSETKEAKTKTGN